MGKMIERITEIMFECFPYDPDFYTCFVDAVRIRIAAKQIAALCEAEVAKQLRPNVDWAGIDPVKFKDV